MSHSALGSMLLSDLLGSEVRSAGGAVLGRLVDMTVEFGDDRPVVRRVAVGRRRRVYLLVQWDAVTSFEQGDIRVSTSAEQGGESDSQMALSEHELFLARDVLDTQIVDVAGKRLARVSDVVIERSDAVLRVAAVEVGAVGVWRRIGMGRLVRNRPGRMVDWSDLHLTSARGHALQLAAPAAVVHRLAPTELASVVAHLPTARAVEVLDAVPASAAVGALSASHPGVGARLLHAASRKTASSMVASMPADDAAAVLRHLSPDTVDALLEGVVSERAMTLRRLLAHRADTAGGLMNSEVRTAAVGESVEMIRDRVAADLPELEGLATVFVVDDDGRPVGSFQPNDLLAGRTMPRSVPVVPAMLPVDRVIDLFALHDYLALPVVDTEGRLVGVVAIDDVLEELLVERLPGQGRYARIRRGAQAMRSWRHWFREPDVSR